MRAMTIGLLAAAVVAAAGGARADDEVEDAGSVAAVQNRAYRMGQELELAAGLLPNDAFYKAFAPEGSYTFHFGDSWAWEVVRLGYAEDLDTNLKTQLLQLGTQPTQFLEARLFLTSDVVWSPLYLKASVLGDSVIHGEAFVVLGGGAFDMVAGGSNQNSFYPAPNAGVGLRVFLSQVFSVRLDVRDHVLFIPQNVTNVLDVDLGLSLNFLAPE